MTIFSVFSSDAETRRNGMEQGQVNMKDVEATECICFDRFVCRGTVKVKEPIDGMQLLGTMSVRSVMGVL